MPWEITCPQLTAAEIPTAFSLGANYPNPPNPASTIRFALPEPQHADLAVYGLDARRVAQVVSDSRAPGEHEVVWTGKDANERQVAPGTYFCRIDAGPFQQVMNGNEAQVHDRIRAPRPHSQPMLRTHQGTLSQYRGMRGPVIQTDEYPSAEACARSVIDRIKSSRRLLSPNSE